jgi:hypothetical protein
VWCRFENGRPPSKAAWSHFAASRTRSSGHADADAHVQGEGDTYVERCVGLNVRKLQRHCHGMLCFEVGDGFDVLVQVHVASAEVLVPLPSPARSPTSFAIASHCLWYSSMALLKSPCVNEVMC